MIHITHGKNHLKYQFVDNLDRQFHLLVLEFFEMLDVHSDFHNQYIRMCDRFLLLVLFVCPSSNYDNPLIFVTQRLSKPLLRLIPFRRRYRDAKD